MFTKKIKYMSSQDFYRNYYALEQGDLSKDAINICEMMDRYAASLHQCGGWKEEQEKLWDEVEDIFDKHTSPTGGGYEADYTHKGGFISELKEKYIIATNSESCSCKENELRKEIEELKMKLLVTEMGWADALDKLKPKQL
jgi:hypothetical protein